MDPITIGLSAAGLLANLFGQSKAAKATKEQNKLVGGQIADLTSWHDTQKNQPYIDSNVGRSVINKALDTFKGQAKTAESTAAITGASDEAVIAAKGNLQDALGNVFSNVAAQGTAREDQIENRYRSNLGQLLAVKMGLQGQQAQSGANLAGTASSFLQGLAPMFAGTGNNALKGLNQFGRTAGQEGALKQMGIMSTNSILKNSGSGILQL